MSIIPDDEIEKFENFIKTHEHFLVAGHKEPDGDCIASCIGVSKILEHFNKSYELLSAGPFKRNEIKRYEDLFSSSIGFLDESDRKKTGLIIVDCCEISRLGDLNGDLGNIDIYIIDHHKTGDLPENSQGFIKDTAPACAYLIQMYYEAVIGDLPLDVANILFLGICTDTGYFRFLSSDSADVFMAVSRLVSYGVNPKATYNQMNSGKAYSTRKLLGVLLSRAERYLDGRLVITYETMEDTKKYGAEGRDSDALYQLLLSCDKVEVAVFLRQDTVLTCTGGFRSVDKVDVSVVAQKFCGGGHKNASGMSCNGRLDTLIPQIVKEFAKVM